MLVSAPAPTKTLTAVPVGPTRRDLDEAGGAAILAAGRIPERFERDRRIAESGIQQYHQQAVAALRRGDAQGAASNLRSLREMHADLVRTWTRKPETDRPAPSGQRHVVEGREWSTGTRWSAERGE